MVRFSRPYNRPASLSHVYTPNLLFTLSSPDLAGCPRPSPVAPLSLVSLLDIPKKIRRAGLPIIRLLFCCDQSAGRVPIAGNYPSLLRLRLSH